jgi:peptidoglycan/LPS O-acetylase OafA/YrhL
MSDISLSPKTIYLKDFDGVRAIAALGVMFHHFFQKYLISEKNGYLYDIGKITLIGQTGVTLFFVLSGFLITRILLNTKTQTNYFSTFYIRRALRIFPLYYLFLIIYFFINPLSSGGQVVPASQQWYYWVYLQNFALTFNWDSAGPLHYWSLGVEEHFYLFWPVLVYFVDIKHLSKVIYFIIGCALVTRYILFSNGYQVFYFTFTTMDALAVGAFLAVQEFKGVTSTKSSSNKFLLLFFILIVPTVLCWVVVSGKAMLWVQVFKLLFISLIYYSLLGYLLGLNQSSFIKKILCSKLLQYTGKISYGLYVYHILCFGYFSLIATTYVFVNLLGSFCLAYIMASLSYWLFESKFLELKKYFYYKNK